MGHVWPNAFCRVLLSPSLTDDDVVLYAESCYEHAVHLATYPTRNNWVMMEMAGLYAVGVVFPEFKESERWRDFAARRMFDEQQKQFLPDGTQAELVDRLSPGVSAQHHGDRGPGGGDGPDAGTACRLRGQRTRRHTRLICS